MRNIDKVVLGTVQFGLNYGINNKIGQVTYDNVNSILSLAESVGVRLIDTSYAYGDSEISLGKAFESQNFNFKIISKYPASIEPVNSIFEESLKRLGKDKIYGYLVHNFDHFKSDTSIWNDFLMLRDMGYVSKIGYSIYSIEQLNYLFDNKFEFDLIQFPFNIFDRQFEPYLSDLKNRNVEIHTRSVFLQGLFFKDPTTLTGKLTALKPYLNDLNDFCNVNNITVNQLAMSYVINKKNIDGVLIGVDSVEQLKNNLEGINYDIRSEFIDFINSLVIKEVDLLNPVNWI